MAFKSKLESNLLPLPQELPVTNILRMEKVSVSGHYAGDEKSIHTFVITTAFLQLQRADMQSPFFSPFSSLLHRQKSTPFPSSSLHCHCAVALSPVLCLPVTPLLLDAGSSVFTRSVLLPGLHVWKEVMWLRFCPCVDTLGCSTLSRIYTLPHHIVYYSLYIEFAPFRVKILMRSYATLLL